MQSPSHTPNRAELRPTESRWFRSVFLLIAASCSSHDSNPVRESGPPFLEPEIGEISTGRQISQYGVTWTLASEATYGRFANGDYWVVGPIKVSSITPATVTVAGRTINGWDVNPLPPNAQGYDTCAGDYSASDVPALPYVANPGSSIVQAVSAAVPHAGSTVQCLQTATVLTVVDKVPPDNGATVFRPPYVGAKSLPMAYVSTNSIHWDRLPSLVPTSAVTFFAPKITDQVSRLNRVQLDHMNGRQLNVSAYAYNGVPNAQINPFDNMANYGPNINLENNDAILRLTLNDSVADKAPLMVAVIQGGIDRHAMLLNGQFWPPGSGMYGGRKISIAFAATMLEDAAMKQSVTGQHVLGMPNFFLEDSTIGIGYQGKALYGSGLPDVNPCGNPYQACDFPDYAYYWNWATHTIGVNNGSSDPYGYTDGSMNGTQGGDAYQGINSPGFAGSALIGILMPTLQTVWGHPEFFRYADRWVNHGAVALPDPCAPLSAGGGPDPNNLGGCVLDPNLEPGSTMKHFSCQPGKICGRFPQYEGQGANSGGSYESPFANAMWNSYRNAASAGVYVSLTGIGQGTAISSPAGIDCGIECGASFPIGTVVTLTAQPDAAATFAGWSGACSGTGTCSITIKALSSQLPTSSACPGAPPGFTCSAPPTSNVDVSAAFE